MKLKRVAGRGAVGLAVAALLGVASVADAAVVYRDSFERPRKASKQVGGAAEATPHGVGWRTGAKGPEYFVPFQGIVIDLDLIGVHREGGLERGTMSFWIQRNEALQNETVVNFTDANYGVRVAFDLEWPGEPEYGYNVPTLMQWAPDIYQYPLWYVTAKGGSGDPRVVHSQTFELPQIARGQWFNLAFTWGPGPGENAILVNGRKVDAQPEEGFAMQRLLRDSKYLVLGARVDRDWGGKDPSLPRSHSAMRSVLDAVEILDTVAAPFESVYEDPDAARVRAIEHNASRKAGFSGKLVAGDVVDVTLRGTPGGTASFDVAHFPDLNRTIELDWRGWGVYLEEKTFFEAGEVNLRDVRAYRVYAGTSPIPDVAALGDLAFERLDFKVQQYKLENLEIDTPYYFAVVAVMADGTLRKVIGTPAGLPLAETEPGGYTGTWKAGYEDRLPRAVLVGHLTKGAASAVLADDATAAFAVDPALAITVASEPAVLKADEKSTAKVTVTVLDANGNAVPGHELKFLLATTSQYTGVVGGGAFAEQVGGSLRGAVSGETDLFGRMTVTYVAGFAAKTAVIVARDMASNSTGAGFVKTFIQSTAQLELEPLVLPMSAEGYKIRVTSSDEWLTADGQSTARITAKVTKDGEPVEGHRVRFAVASGTGSIRVVSAVTDKHGEARAVYTAGIKIGLVLVTATDLNIELSGSVQIELRSDAPAKIAIKLDPEKLPADGRSTAEVNVLVTDINDNPNDNVEVEYAIVEGSGELREERTVTDRRGETRNSYTAGETPGRVSIELTVRSPEPTAEELQQARELAVSVLDYDFF